MNISRIIFFFNFLEKFLWNFFVIYCYCKKLTSNCFFEKIFFQEIVFEKKIF